MCEAILEPVLVESSSSLLLSSSPYDNISLFRHSDKECKFVNRLF